MDFRLQTSYFSLRTYFGLQTSDFNLHCQISDGRRTEDFGQTSGSFQTSDILRTNFEHTSDVGLQTPTSDVGLRTDFEHRTSNFKLLTLDFGLLFQTWDNIFWTLDSLLISDFGFQTSDRLWISSFGHISDLGL